MPLFAIIGAALFGGLLIGSSRRPRYRERHAHAKSMIDAVTGHQPSPLDCEYSSEKPATPKQKLGEKSAKTHRIENE